MGEQVAARLIKKVKKEKWKSGRLTQWGRSSVGRAPALQAGGQEFESLRLHCRIILQRTLKTEYRKSKKISNGSSRKDCRICKKDKTSEAVIVKMTETNKQKR